MTSKKDKYDLYISMVSTSLNVFFFQLTLPIEKTAYVSLRLYLKKLVFLSIERYFQHSASCHFLHTKKKRKTSAQTANGALLTSGKNLLADISTLALIL